MKVWDLHCDTLSELRKAEHAGRPKSFAQNDLHIDLEKLQKGDYLLQCFAAFVNLGDKTPGADPLVTALEEIDQFKRIMAAYPEKIAPVYTAADIRRNAAAGKISGMLTIEEGACCKGSVGVLRRQGRFGVEGSLWLGPLCNGNNREQMTALTEGLREAAERVHAISLTCWPNQVYCVRDSQGKAMAEPNDEMVREYERLGWKHAGFTRGYDALMNRWNYVKDLREFSNAGELLASYAKNTRRNVKIARNSGVEVRRLNRSELNVFHDICELSSERQHFANRSLDYFERVYDAFGDKAEFMVAEVHLDRYLQSWEEKLAKFSKDVERLERSLEHTKYPDDVRKKLDTAQKNVESARRRIEDANERIARDGEVVPVAVGLFMWHERELVYFSSGSDDRYAKFYAPTAL